jgi:spore coat protein U-like protein
MRYVWWILACLGTQCLADPSPVSRAFQVSAVVSKGCVFGISTTDQLSDLGTLDFGTVSNFFAGQDAVSAAGNGSIVLTCTPGISVAIGLGNGLHGATANERYMQRVGGTELIAYQLYQDASRTTVWGTGAQARVLSSFPVTTQTYTVYARLVGGNRWPRAGEYLDRVVVELQY